MWCGGGWLPRTEWCGHCCWRGGCCGPPVPLRRPRAPRQPPARAPAPGAPPPRRDAPPSRPPRGMGRPGGARRGRGAGGAGGPGAVGRRRAPETPARALHPPAPRAGMSPGGDGLVLTGLKSDHRPGDLFWSMRTPHRGKAGAGAGPRPGDPGAAASGGLCRVVRGPTPRDFPRETARCIPTGPHTAGGHHQTDRRWLGAAAGRPGGGQALRPAGPCPAPDARVRLAGGGQAIRVGVGRSG